MPARIEPEPPIANSAEPEVLATVQSPHPPLPRSIDVAPRPIEPNTAEFSVLTSTARGVRHALDEVQHVRLDDRGHIAGIDTAGRRTLAADLYVDCTAC